MSDHATLNFKFSEYGVVPSELRGNVKRNAEQLEILRESFDGAAVSVWSGVRTVANNRGAKNSQHLYGRAADITIAGTTAREVYLRVLKLVSEGRMLQGGVGYYAPRAGGKGNFTHYDTRGNKARWWMDSSGKVHSGVPSWALSVDKGDGLSFTELDEDQDIGSGTDSDGAGVVGGLDLVGAF